MQEYFCKKITKIHHCSLTLSSQYPFQFPSKVTQYNVPPTRALELSQATCERTGFYARIRRWRARQESFVIGEPATTPPSDVSSLTTPSVTSTSSNTADFSTTTTRSDRRVQYLKANMTSWTDFEKTTKQCRREKNDRPQR